MNEDTLKKYARQYVVLKDELGVLSNRQSELKARILAELDTAKPNMNGHRVFEFEDQHMGEIKVTKQRRVSKALDMQVAEEILTRKGIKDACIKMIPTLDEAAIMSAFYEGHLTEEDIDSMFPAKESYALIINK